jgi:hypothetical protein
MLVFTSCTNNHKQVEHENQKIILNNLPVINTISEIKVYNDFIDQVYKITYCHLEMDTPEEYLSYHENISKEEYKKYKKEFGLYMKHFNEMLDTSKIIVFVPDSLYEFKMPSSYLNSNLDSVQLLLFHDLVKDTSLMPSEPYSLDSLKSKKIYFERTPFHRTDLDKLSEDSVLKYYDNVMDWFQRHVGHQVGNKYYIGSIDLSRVKFNQDSTLCILECGYQAQSKCGYGYYYLLRKIKGKWTVITRLSSWIS